MGGASDLSNRSSSPLKRPASELEADLDMNAIEPDTPDTTQDEIPIPSITKAKTEIPDIDYQITTITTLIGTEQQTHLREGSKIWLISRAWLQKVIDRGTEAKRKSKKEPEGEVGHIDNSDIIQEIIKDSEGKNFVRLKHGLGSESFELLNEDAWKLVEDWYGLMPGSHPIIRYAHNTNTGAGASNIQYEFHPPIIRVHRLWSEVSGIMVDDLRSQKPAPPVFVVSRSDRYVDFLKKAKEKAGIPLTKRVKVWRVPRLQPAFEPIAPDVNMSTPPTSRPSSPELSTANVSSSREPQDSWTELFVDVPTFTALERIVQRDEIKDFKDETNNPNYNGQSNLSLVGLGDDLAVVLDENVSGNDTWVSNATKMRASKNLSTSYIPSTSQSNSGRNSPTPSGIVTRSKTRGNSRGRSKRSPGTVGLSNLGNTCYMNSALQCIRSVEELTKYFLTGSDQDELNTDNPLGNNGEVAVAYGKLLREIYADSAPSVVTPRGFKNTIGRYAPSFSGYGQQDSQEFIGFLLDGLQEDLSRVHKKPYIEKPDSTDEMVNDPEAIREMAKQVWDITKKRDDSVIADLFTGMYKSTLVCPEPDCRKVSITFDPFNNLTLQLPIESSWTHRCFYFPLSDAPIEIVIDVDKHATILDVKKFLSDRVNVPVERIMVSEHWKQKFYKHYADGDTASDVVSSGDDFYAFELESKPTNWPAPKKTAKKAKAKSAFLSNDSDEDVPHWDDPMAERMLVPVFWRKNNTGRGYNSRDNKSFVQCPCYIVLTPVEASNEDTIKRKILEKVSTFTRHSVFDEDEVESIDPDLVLANGSESSSEGKIVTSSIDGEDGFVDITMKENDGASSLDATSLENEGPTANTITPVIHQPIDINTRRHKFVTDPTSFLKPELQNMFEIGYHTTTDRILPTGWSNMNENGEFPSIASRLPVVQDASESESPVDLDRSESSNEDDTLSQDHGSSNLTRMADESESDEDELAAPIVQQRALPVREKPSSLTVTSGRNGRRNNKRFQTYSKKTKNKQMRSRNNQFKQQKSSMLQQFDGSNDTPDGGPLVRLGEALVVTWGDDAWNELFEGRGGFDPVGVTYNPFRTYQDAGLIAKQKSREARRRGGITLDDCLDEFGKEEILSEADTWYCPRCKEHRRAIKKFELWKTPDILVMHLKRFSSSQTRRDKLDVKVDFPIENLDLTSRVIETEEGKKEIYDLIAIDDHWGGLGGGHYTAYAKNFEDHEWYNYNDTSVTKEKNLSSMITSSAYLLFYRRRSEIPLGGPRFQQIFQKYDHSEASEDENITESGEDQGLVANSSLRGSSSALTGVGAVHRPQNLGSDHNTVNPRDLHDSPPAYEYQSFQSLEDVGLQNDLPLRKSIEDEGIDMDSPPRAVSQPLSEALKPGFSFSNLDFGNKRSDFISGAGSEADEFEGVAVKSDVVEDNSSASSGLRKTRMDDWDESVPEEYVEDNIPPDVDDDTQMDLGDLHSIIQERRPPLFHVSAQQVEDIEDDAAAEIFVGPDDELKID